MKTIIFSEGFVVFTDIGRYFASFAVKILKVISRCRFRFARMDDGLNVVIT